MPKPPKLIVWDWHGVLGVHGFWHKAAKTDTEVQKLAEYIFSDKHRVNAWMRGETSIQTLINDARVTISKEKLAEYLLEDWGQTDSINTQLVSAIKAIYPQAGHIIITDNMDVFSEYSKANTYIARNFDRVFNSSESRTLKDDTPGLFEDVLQQLGFDSFADCLLLDDSKTNCQRFRELGGDAILVEGGYR